MKIAVVGASGRMGLAVVRVARDAGHEIAHAIASHEIDADIGELAGLGSTGVLVTDDLGAIAGIDAVIDFSSPSITADVAEAARRARACLVSGTTGLGGDATEALDACSKEVPVLWEPNMSVGVSVLGDLLARALAMLPDADVEIVETHHRAKLDAPSGTALRLAEIARTARKDAPLVTGREGKPGARGGEIGVLAVRGGDVIGDHQIHLLMGGERLELTHRATSRDLFARGALRAAAWLHGKPAGRYRLRDVLG